MPSEVVGKLEKPEMRRLLQKSIKMNLGVSIGLCLVAVVATKFLVNDVRKRKYADFYRNYDAQVEFEEMKKKGLFQSVST